MVSNNAPEQLLIALEPEAASIHCREMKMREFANEKGDATVSDVFARPGAKYLVIDIGGKIDLSEKWTVLTMSRDKTSKPFLIFLFGNSSVFPISFKSFHLFVKTLGFVWQTCYSN